MNELQNGHIYKEKYIEHSYQFMAEIRSRMELLEKEVKTRIELLEKDVYLIKEIQKRNKESMKYWIVTIIAMISPILLIIKDFL